MVALDEAKKRLKDAGFEQVHEREDWKLQVGKKYFFTRNYSTIVAFTIGKRYAGIRHVDPYYFRISPCFVLNPLLLNKIAELFGRFVAGNGFHIVGAHTDSPCLKLKPVSKVISPSPSCVCVI